MRDVKGGCNRHNLPNCLRSSAFPLQVGIRVLIFFVLFILPWLWLANGVQAHGGGALQIANAPVGECLVSVWLAPTVPRADKPLHVTVGLAEATNQAPILDGEVQVMIHEVASGKQVSAAPATTAQSVNRLFYEADLSALAVGQYQVTVTPTCRGVTQAVSFEVEIRPSTNPLFIALPLAAGGLLVGIWFYRHWTNQQMADHPAPKRTISR